MDRPAGPIPPSPNPPQLLPTNANANAHTQTLHVVSPSVRLLSTAPAADLSKQDIKDVAATTEKWIKTVTGQKPSSPAETASLYAKVHLLGLRCPGRVGLTRGG